MAGRKRRRFGPIPVTVSVSMPPEFVHRIEALRDYHESVTGGVRTSRNTTVMKALELGLAALEEITTRPARKACDTQQAPGPFAQVTTLLAAASGKKGSVQ